MNPGAGTVTMDGSGKTITGLNSTDFGPLVVAGSVTLAGAVDEAEVIARKCRYVADPEATALVRLLVGRLIRDV